MQQELEWDKDTGSSGGWVTHYRKFEVSIQEDETYKNPNTKKWYVCYRILDPKKDYFSGNIKFFTSHYSYADTKEDVMIGAKKQVDKEYYDSYFDKKEVDMRDKGYYCCHCDKFSKTKQMVFGETWICKDKERWLVKDHYDGCHGWD
jgi:hypothetical protein